MTDLNGTVVWSAQYTAFGDATVTVATVTNTLRFPGQYYDAETGLHYNWFRYYDPKIGRYLQTDPLRFLGGDVNLYQYVWSNPAYTGDALGLLSQDKFDLLQYADTLARNPEAVTATTTAVTTTTTAAATGLSGVLTTSVSALVGMGTGGGRRCWQRGGSGIGSRYRNRNRHQ